MVAIASRTVCTADTVVSSSSRAFERYLICWNRWNIEEESGGIVSVSLEGQHSAVIEPLRLCAILLAKTSKALQEDTSAVHAAQELSIDTSFVGIGSVLATKQHVT